MPYDDVLAERVREQVSGEATVTEKRMFGGLSFLAHGNLLVAVSGDDLLVRVGPDGMEDALTRPGAQAAVMGARTMRGWVRADGTTLDEPALTHWLKAALTFTATLPPK